MTALSPYWRDVGLNADGEVEGQGGSRWVGAAVLWRVECEQEGLSTQGDGTTCMSWKTQECQGHMGALPLMHP